MEKNEINAIWLYPDILNNFGDRGNIEALEYMCKNKNIKLNIIKVENFDDPIPYETADIMFLGSGELRVMPRIIERLKKDISKLNEYIENGKYIFVFNLSSSIFAKETIRLSNENFNGLGILPLKIKEKRYNYGDDLHLKIYNGMEIIGSQIQMANYTLCDDKKYFGDVIYGYGNDFYSKKAGVMYKNLIFPNIQGPLFFKNPWYLEYIIDDILKCKKNSNKVLDFNLEDYKEEYPLEVGAFKAAKEFIKSKPKASKKNYLNEYLL